MGIVTTTGIRRVGHTLGDTYRTSGWGDFVDGGGTIGTGVQSGAELLR